jgi:hypothetical protein
LKKCRARHSLQHVLNHRLIFGCGGGAVSSGTNPLDAYSRICAEFEKFAATKAL